MRRLQTPTYELLPSLQAVAEGLEARSPSLLRMEEDFEALLRFMTPGESGCIRTRLVQMRRSWQELMEKTEQLTGQLNQSASYRQRCSDNLEQVFFAICRNDWLFFIYFFWHHKCVFISLGQENDAWSQRETQRFCCALLVVIADVHKPTEPHGKKKKKALYLPSNWLTTSPARSLGSTATFMSVSCPSFQEVCQSVEQLKPRLMTLCSALRRLGESGKVEQEAPHLHELQRELLEKARDKQSTYESLLTLWQRYLVKYPFRDKISLARMPFTYFFYFNFWG